MREKLLTVLGGETELSVYLFQIEEQRLRGEVHISGSQPRLPIETQAEILSGIAEKLLPAPGELYGGFFTAESICEPVERLLRDAQVEQHRLNLADASSIRREGIIYRVPAEGALRTRIIEAVLLCYLSTSVELVGFVAKSPQVERDSNWTDINQVFLHLGRGTDERRGGLARETARADPFWELPELSCFLFCGFEEPYLWFELKTQSLETLRANLREVAEAHAIPLGDIWLVGAKRRKL